MAAVTAADPSAGAGAGERVDDRAVASAGRIKPRTTDVVLCEICERPVGDNDLMANDEHGLIAHLRCPPEDNNISPPEVCNCHPDDNPPTPCPRKHALTECLASASRSPAAGGVAPEGYALVPVDPTPEMLAAGRRAADDKTWAWRGLGRRPDGTGIDGQEFFVRDAYRAMLAEAPTHRVEAGGVAGDLGGVEAAHPDAIRAALAYADHFLMLSMAYSTARIEAWEDGTFSDAEHADARRDLRIEQGKHAELEREFCRWWAPRDGFDGPVRAIDALRRSTAAGDGVRYVVWSNEHTAWWSPDRCGYTTSLEHAGRYTRNDALDISTGGGRRMWADCAQSHNPDEIAIREEDALAMVDRISDEDRARGAQGREGDHA